MNKMESKIARYNNLVQRIKNDTKVLQETNSMNENYLTACDSCDEVNLWTYWQGGKQCLDANILLVGQDWGPLHTKEADAILTEIQNVKDHAAENCTYYVKGVSKTDDNLVELFKSIGYHIDTKKYKQLFFTNYIVGYRNKGLTGSMQPNWTKKCDTYFQELLDIIQPKVILCLGRKVFDWVLKDLNEEKVKGPYNKVVEASNKNPVKVMLGDQTCFVFPLAHCGALGTNNRNKGKEKKEDKLFWQKQDWKLMADLAGIKLEDDI